MDTFDALAAPIRREIVSLLAKSGQLSASAIAEQFRVTPSAVSQHLKVLLDSDVIQMHRQAQRRLYQLNPQTVKDLLGWTEQLVSTLGAHAPLLDKKG